MAKAMSRDIENFRSEFRIFKDMARLNLFGDFKVDVHTAFKAVSPIQLNDDCLKISQNVVICQKIT